MFQYLRTSLSAAPRVFTKLLKPVVGFLRQNGCCLIIRTPRQHANAISRQGPTTTADPTHLPII